MAIRDLCSKKALASVMFLTGPVVAARLAVRSDLLSRVVGDKAGVPVTLVWCVFPGRTGTRCLGAFAHVVWHVCTLTVQFCGGRWEGGGM